MSTRKIKDAIDLETSEKFYFRGHAKATYMSDGRTVEDAINDIPTGGGGDLSDYITRDELSDGATSGSYNDLNDKPTIPTKVSQLENDEEYSTPIHGSDYNTQYIDVVATDFINVASDLDLNTSSETKRVTSSYAVDYNRYGGITSINESPSYVYRKKVNEATSSKAGFMTATDKAKLDGIDMSTKQDNLISGTNIKTINGQSILGSGDITIEGGSGGSSESPIFLTHFSIDRFISGYVPFTDEQKAAIREAASQNKIIAIPYSVDGDYTGFTVATYYYSHTEIDGEEYWRLGISVIYNDISYGNSMNQWNIGFTADNFSSYSFIPYIEGIEVDEDGYAEVYLKMDDSIVFVQGECRHLYVSGYAEIGVSVRFFTGEDCTLEMNETYWANGVVPTIEPYTHYELSIAYNQDYGCNAVLTPFKQVES